MRASRLVLLFAILLFPCIAAAETVALLADAQTTTSGANYGRRRALWVRGSGNAAGPQTAYLLFDLASLPFGTLGASVSKATLTLGIGKVRGAGTFDVVRVLGATPGAWSESGLTSATAPPLASVPEATGLTVAPTDKNTFRTVDVTPLVREWLDGLLPNNGLALAPSSSEVAVAFDSKENTGTSHFPWRSPWTPSAPSPAAFSAT